MPSNIINKARCLNAPALRKHEFAFIELQQLMDINHSNILRIITFSETKTTIFLCLIGDALSHQSNVFGMFLY